MTEATALSRQLVQTRQQLELMQQFFHEHRSREKARLRADDGERLQRMRAHPDYEAAFHGEPLITVIIPTYNRAQLVAERTLPSVLAQDYAHWELIIVGDQMDEEQAALLRRAAQGDQRVHFHNLRRRGRYPALRGPCWYVAGTKPVNFGLRVARGAWIAHLDDDDEFLPAHLSTLLAEARRSHTEWAHGKVRFIGDDGRPQAVVGSPQPCHGGTTRIGSLYHAGLKGFRYNPGCWKYFYPGDWDLWERFLDMGVRHTHSSAITAIHHGDYFREEVLGDGQAATASAPALLDYAGWLAQQCVQPARIEALQRDGRLQASLAVAVVGAGDAAQRSCDSVAAQSLDGVATLAVAADAEGSWGEALNRVAADSDADWLLVLAAGDTLSTDAAAILAEKVTAEPQLVMCYVDEDARQDDGSASPILKPDINLDLLRSYPYIGHVFAVRREALLALGGVQNVHGDLAGYDLAFRAIERYGLQSIGHVAAVLCHCARSYADWMTSAGANGASAAVVTAHLQRLGVAHRIEPGPFPAANRVHYQHPHEPPVSIIIPTRDQLPLLNALVDSLLAKTRYRNYELLIVDNDSRDPAACAFLDGIEKLNSPQLRVLRYPHPFNYSAINNAAAAQARGEYLILLNNDTAVLHEDWIEALLNHAQRPEVGIVGAKLHYPDGRIQHAGVVLGMQGPAGHPFIGESMQAPGYMQRLQVDQNYSAVTAACLMIRKSVYDEVGGLDEEQFKVSYNDVDLCLKVREAGYLTVWTPYARLMHEGNVSQKQVDKASAAAKRERFRGEQDAMYRKWMPQLGRDPAYNRNLSLDGAGYTLALEREPCWQPFVRPALPRVLAVPADGEGCGQYRIRQPFAAMAGAGLIEGRVAERHLTPVELERFQPATVVLQRQLSDAQIDSLRRYREFSGALKVYELDDLLTQLPPKSSARERMPADIARSLRRALSLVDRFVVSTAPLAEAFTGFHDDIRVVRNRLPKSWWADLSARRQRGRRPRVGWAGGNAHRGDLELIAEVVRELAGEVEWVFFGMCPEAIRAHVHEVHAGVPIADYPARLAALDLDLALAPVEDNAFNRCKSNLRLLEYGACGFPVICSDVQCYQDALPVTRVKNRYKDWVAAIREHVADADACARRGDALREVVRRDWMLDDDAMAAWCAAWLP